LHGKQLKMPKGYKGVVMTKSDRILPKIEATKSEEDGDVEDEPDVKVMEEQSHFDEIMVWGHESLPDETADPYVRGIEEWISFSESVSVTQLMNRDINLLTPIDPLIYRREIRENLRYLITF
jgi:ribonuclease H2 subunit C